MSHKQEEEKINKRIKMLCNEFGYDVDHFMEISKNDHDVELLTDEDKLQLTNIALLKVFMELDEGTISIISVLFEATTGLTFIKKSDLVEYFSKAITDPFQYGKLASTIVMIQKKEKMTDSFMDSIDELISELESISAKGSR